VKFKSAVITQASGSIGGLTASHNRGGMYFRARAIPVNPGSPQQDGVRSAFSSLATAWTDDLTPAQRDGWNDYATNAIVTDVFGDERRISGINHFIRSNALRLQAGLAQINVAPLFTTGVTFGTPTIDAWDLALQEIDIAYNPALWRTQTGGALLTFISRPQGTGITYFRGPYRFAGAILGDSGSPPSSPQTLSLPFTYAATQVAFGYTRAILADGRISSPAYFSSIAT
jgi:hypothetical protein